MISGNGRAGIVVQVGQTVIQGNQIGTAVDGTTALANSSHGIVVTNKAANTQIGGTDPGEGNVIAFNARAGVLIGRDTTFTVAAGNGNSVLGNSIFSNDLLGIIRNSTANRRQTFPTINTATIITAGTQVQVNFQLASVPNRTFRVELFASPVADTLGFGEGRNFLGFIDVTTDGSGNVSSTATVYWSAGLGNFITATATRLDTNDSSSFSAAVLATCEPALELKNPCRPAAPRPGDFILRTGA